MTRRVQRPGPYGIPAPPRMLRHRDLPAMERQRREQRRRGRRRRDSDGRVLVPEVGFDHRRGRDARSVRCDTPAAKIRFVGHGEKNQAVRTGVPPSCEVGVFDSELERGVRGLGRLEARGKIRAAQNVELAGQIRVALVVRGHGVERTHSGDTPSTTPPGRLSHETPDVVDLRMYRCHLSGLRDRNLSGVEGPPVLDCYLNMPGQAVLADRQEEQTEKAEGKAHDGEHDGVARHHLDDGRLFGDDPCASPEGNVPVRGDDAGVGDADVADRVQDHGGSRRRWRGEG